ncbi:MAG: hypothetical protein QOI07_3765 [Verrucomicrobiota bacterium]
MIRPHASGSESAVHAPTSIQLGATLDGDGRFQARSRRSSAGTIRSPESEPVSSWTTSSSSTAAVSLISAKPKMPPAPAHAARAECRDCIKNSNKVRSRAGPILVNVRTGKIARNLRACSSRSVSYSPRACPAPLSIRTSGYGRRANPPLSHFKPRPLFSRHERAICVSAPRVLPG